MRIRMADRKLQKDLIVMKVPVKSIRMLHGRQQTSTTLILQSEHTNSFEKFSTVLQDNLESFIESNGKKYSREY